MDFAFDAKTEELSKKLNSFMDEFVYPAEPIAHQQMADAPDHWGPPPILDDLKAQAKKRGLWNFFLPGDDGAGLTNLQYAPLAEITGRSIMLAPAAVNCAAPDTGTNEFFICVGDQPQLDFGGKRNPDGQGFAAFGRVVRGMDVVKKIGSTRTGDRDRPIKDIVVQSVKIVRK